MVRRQRCKQVTSRRNSGQAIVLREARKNSRGLVFQVDRTAASFRLYLVGLSGRWKRPPPKHRSPPPRPARINSARLHRSHQISYWPPEFVSPRHSHSPSGSCAAAPVSTMDGVWELHRFPSCDRLSPYAKQQQKKAKLLMRSLTALHMIPSICSGISAAKVLQHAVYRHVRGHFGRLDAATALYGRPRRSLSRSLWALCARVLEHLAKTGDSTFNPTFKRLAATPARITS